jgi:hypothetical protein
VRDLSKKKLGEFSRGLAAAQGAFRATIEQLAEEARTEILPYFKRHDLDYRAGNGTWLITRGVRGERRAGCIGDAMYSDDDLPSNIRELLMLEVSHADHLGFYIRDIKRGEW